MPLTRADFSLFANLAAIVAANLRADTRAETTSGDRYLISASDLGSGSLMANGLYANPLLSDSSTLTTTDLINSSASVVTGEIIETSGFITPGDGGGAKWKVTGNTIAASQTPALTGSATCSDSNGNEFVLIDDGCISVKKLGAVGDGVTDDHAAIQSAIDSVLGGIVTFPEGDYLVSDELVVSSEGTQLVGVGAGSFADGINNFKTRIISSSLTKSVIRVKLENCVLKDFLVDATAARIAAVQDNTATNYNGGVRVEADDVAAPEGDVFDTRVIGVHIVNQPSDGLILVGRCYGGYIKDCAFTNNSGHGLNITTGKYTGRTNIAIPGSITMEDTAYKNNDGHGLRVGDLTQDDFAIRIVSINSGGFNNAGNVTLLEDLAETFVHCDGFTVINGEATGTDKAGTPMAVAGYSLAGAGGVLIDARILDTSEPIRFMTPTGRSTYGWTVINPHVRTTASAYMSFLDTGVENIQIRGGDNIGALAQATNRTDSLGLDTYINGDKTQNYSLTNLGDQFDSSGLKQNTTKQDNKSITTTPIFIFDASTSGKMWEVSGRHTGDPCASSFRCDVVGGSVPVISNTTNQTGAGVLYVLSVSGTNVELATNSGARNTDVFIKEIVTA